MTKLVQHVKLRLVIEMESTYHPVPLTLSSDPQRQRNWMTWPEAVEGKLTVEVMNPPELPLQARRPDRGFL